MTERALGAFIFFSVIGIVLLALTIRKPTIGLSTVAAFLGLVGLGFFVSAATAMHEIEGILFIVGSAICAGLAGTVRQVRLLRSEIATGSKHEK